MVQKKRYVNSDEDISGFAEDDDYCPYCKSLHITVLLRSITKVNYFCMSCEEEWEIKV